jgi:hypothetical protein
VIRLHTRGRGGQQPSTYGGSGVSRVVGERTGAVRRRCPVFARCSASQSRVPRVTRPAPFEMLSSRVHGPTVSATSTPRSRSRRYCFRVCPRNRSCQPPRAAPGPVRGPVRRPTGGVGDDACRRGARRPPPQVQQRPAPSAMGQSGAIPLRFRLPPGPRRSRVRRRDRRPLLRVRISHLRCGRRGVVVGSRPGRTPPPSRRPGPWRPPGPTPIHRRRVSRARHAPERPAPPNRSL